MAKAKLNKNTIALLVAIALGTVSEQYVHVNTATAAPLVDAGLVELNTSMTNADGDHPARTTDAGLAEARVHSPELNGTAPGAGDAGDAGATAGATAGGNDANLSGFDLSDDLPIPPAPKGGRAGGSKYPWGAMNVNQSFFVPERTPAQFGSTVATAHKSFAEVNEAGEIVKYNRKFVVRAVTENGKLGIRVWRTV